MLAIEEFRRMNATLAINDIVPPDIAICAPRGFLSGALYNQNLFNVMFSL